MPHRVTLIPGDGIGPELSEATRRVLEATGVEFDWDVREAGADVMAKHGGNPLPDSVIESIAHTGVAIKGREIIELKGQDLYAIYPDGAGESKLTIGVIERKLGVKTSARNWNTALKIAALFEG